MQTSECQATAVEAETLVQFGLSSAFPEAEREKVKSALTVLVGSIKSLLGLSAENKAVAFLGLHGPAWYLKRSESTLYPHDLTDLPHAMNQLGITPRHIVPPLLPAASSDWVEYILEAACIARSRLPLKAHSGFYYNADDVEQEACWSRLINSNVVAIVGARELRRNAYRRLMVGLRIHGAQFFLPIVLDALGSLEVWKALFNKLVAVPPKDHRTSTSINLVERFTLTPEFENKRAIFVVNAITSYISNANQWPAGVTNSIILLRRKAANLDRVNSDATLTHKERRAGKATTKITPYEAIRQHLPDVTSYEQLEKFAAVVRTAAPLSVVTIVCHKELSAADRGIITALFGGQAASTLKLVFVTKRAQILDDPRLGTDLDYIIAEAPSPTHSQDMPTGAMPLLEPGPEARSTGVPEAAVGSTAVQEPDRHEMIVGKVPFISADHPFEGRDRTLREIHANFACGQGMIALAGFGGSGKTRTALEYAKQHASSYKQRMFISGASRHSLFEDLGELALSDGIKLPVEDQDYSGVLNWMRQNAGWLLIIDNVDDPDVAHVVFTRLRSSLITGNTIITTRLRDLWPEMPEVPLSMKLPLRSAAKILLWPNPELKHQRNIAVRLAKRIGQLPLILRHAAETIKKLDKDFEWYLDSWMRNRAALQLDRRFSLLSDYDRSLATTWTTTFKLLSPASQHLVEILAWFDCDELSDVVPNCVPAGFVDGSVADGRADLLTFTFLEAQPEPRTGGTARSGAGSGDSKYIMSRVFQETSRERMSKDVGAATLGKAAQWAIGGLRSHEQDFVPHVLSVLHHFTDEKWRNLEATDQLDYVVKLLIFALRTGAAQYEPDLLSSILGSFYEVEPLVPVLVELVKRRSRWPAYQETLLGANNYVLRYAMGEALASVWEEEQRDRVELETLVQSGRRLAEFELGAFALTIVYALDPPSDHRPLDPIARRPVYSGRAALGQLFLSIPLSRPTERFKVLLKDKDWMKWEFVATDIAWLGAMDEYLFGAAAERGRSSEIVELIADTDALRECLRNRAPNASIADILSKDAYFNAAVFNDELRKLKEANEQLDDIYEWNRYRDFIKLIFAHPVWVVAESGASLFHDVMQLKPREDSFYTDFLRQCFEDQNWHIQYGAIEAAYQIRHIDFDIYKLSLKRFHKDPQANSKIVGLCAENLTSLILNSSSASAENEPFSQPFLFQIFEEHIEEWVRSEEAWVLDHMHRLFSILIEREQANKRYLPANTSRLLAEQDKWYEMPREQFLMHIEAQKG